ncbi:maleylpyruvate isomerase N-terminal domain-containing protein [Streptomyces mayonensis]|uniref:maleylpyruvate isomerase N-terminal domain-containing protein n=1 Tax=Streptomyces mayonensis TaxID=2750816 RepID=UPI001C1E5893|nr:maleylpyruvate isomerase N-terminal domain-containing protein [Streptomyces sp. A108]MBU6529605.1 maleylpyruvate isomerase N-terminal domain-containing protein [Streptomyces sp. A108]
MTDGAPSVCLQWMTEGHAYFVSCLKGIDDAGLAGPTALRGWTGKHLLSHVGHNARALTRLADWAQTGIETPMYADASARAEEIETGAGWSTARLRDFVVDEQDRLSAALGRIDDERWRTSVVTAQGRTVPATTIPWLRCREVWIHACDLPGGGDFGAFPDDFTDVLIDDVLVRRRGAQSVDVSVRATDRAQDERTAGTSGNVVEGPAADLARWLTRGFAGPRLRAVSGGTLPELPSWL